MCLVEFGVVFLCGFYNLVVGNSGGVWGVWNMKAGYPYQPDEIYREALERVEGSEVLRGYKHIIMQDWSEGDEHWEWVKTADEDDIEYWAKCIVRSMGE